MGGTQVNIPNITTVIVTLLINKVFCVSESISLPVIKRCQESLNTFQFPLNGDFPQFKREDRFCFTAFRKVSASDHKLARWNVSGGSVVKNWPANAGDTGSIPGPRRSHMVRSN